MKRIIQNIRKKNNKNIYNNYLNDNYKKYTFELDFGIVYVGARGGG